MSIALIIFKIGAFFRNPRLFEYRFIFIESDFLSQKDLRDIKRKKLDFLLEFVTKYSLYYSNFKTKYKDPFVWLDSLPIMDKMELINQSSNIHTKYNFKKTFKSETSGTSGDPLIFKKNRRWDTINRASWMRNYSWYGVKPWDRNGVFWGYSFTPLQRTKTRFFDFLQNRFRLFSYGEQDVDVFLKKLKSAKYLHGYSSMIYEVACIGEKLGYSPKDFPNLKMIKGTSEKIYPFYHDVVKRVFGLKIISEYGAAETGIIAFECPNGHMHINEENVIVEDINGEIVVTNLNSFSFPIIRYKLGDAIKLAPYSVCTCGRESNIIIEIEGRVGKSILGKQQKYPSLTLYYIFKNLALHHNLQLQYQGYQEEKGVLILRIPQVITENHEKLILKEAKDYFRLDLDVRVEQNVQIHTKTGKLKDFISEIE
jgi:phenylacetate-CoA ligase